MFQHPPLLQNHPRSFNKTTRRLSTLINMSILLIGFMWSRSNIGNLTVKEFTEFFVGVLLFAVVSAFPQFWNCSSCDVVCWLIFFVLISIILDHSLVSLKHNCSMLSVKSKSLDDGSDDGGEDSSELGFQESYFVAEFLCCNVSYLNSKD